MAHNSDFTHDTYTLKLVMNVKIHTQVFICSACQSNHDDTKLWQLYPIVLKLFCMRKFDQSQPKLLYTFRKLSTTVPPNDEPSEGHKNTSSIPDVYSFVVPTSNLKRTFDGICIHKSTIGLTAK